jgi:hypothetical protein
MTLHRNRGAILTTAAVLAFSVAATTLAKRQDNSAKQSKSAESPKAAPEMDRLKFYLGEWDYTETYPKGGKNTGLYISKLGPGGNSLINTFHSQGPVGDFEGMLVYTWDPREKCYKAYAFGGDFPGALVETGQFEGDDLVFRSEMNAGGTTMKLRNSTHLIAPGKLVTDEYVSRNEAPESLLVHVEATKR